MKPIHRMLVLLSVIIVAFSCKKFVQVEPGTDIIESNLVFSNEKTALSTVSGVYTFLRTNFSVFTNGGLSVNAGLAADELFPTASTSTGVVFYQNQLLSTNTTISSAFYNHAYKVIYQTNAVMEGLSNSIALQDSLKRQIRGEMLTIRSLMYFYLVNLFGDVPLITSTDYTTNNLTPRTAQAEIVQLMIKDLNEAMTLLNSYYPSAGKARINKWTAQAFLSRVYLYNKDWQKAEEFASAVINSGNYSMQPATSIASVFLKNSNETIWEMPGANERNPTGEATTFVPGSSSVKPTYALTSQLLSVFETGDIRKQNWLAKNTISGTEYWYPMKYKQSTVPTGGTLNEYQIVFRLAEMYLIRSEARANQDNINGAKDDVNKIRNRAGLASSNAATKDLLLTAIEKENQSEFFCEWGHRWLDLKRKSKADLVLGPLKPGTWQSTDVLWPIPENELLYNPNLSQNPGY